MKDLDISQFKPQLLVAWKKIVRYRFYLLSLTVLLLLSIVIIDIGAVSTIEADSTKIEGEAESSEVSTIDYSVLSEINQRVEQSNQSVNNVSSQNPFSLSD